MSSQGATYRQCAYLSCGVAASSRFIALLAPPTIIADVKRQTVGSIQRDRRLT